MEASENQTTPTNKTSEAFEPQIPKSASAAQPAPSEQAGGPQKAKKKRLTWRQRLARTALNTLRTILIIVCLLAIGLTIFPQGRAAARTALLLPALVSTSEPAALVAIGEQVRHREMTITSSSGPVYLDIFEPTSPAPAWKPARGGILIVPGVGDNRKFAPLVNLSRSMARTGLVVMTVLTPAIANFDIVAQDKDAIVQAFLALTKQPGVDKDHVGMLAFSAGVPLISFAAADPRISAQVAFVAADGGYFDTETTLRAFARRAIDIDGKTEHWEPISVAMHVMANIITRDLPQAERDRIRLALAEIKPQPMTPAEVAALSPQGHAAYMLLTGGEPEKVDQNIAQLSPATQALLDQLSPKQVLAQIKAPVYLLHDRNDHSIPPTESRAFAAALQQLNHPYHYVEFHIFDHVEMRSQVAIGQLIGDGSQLFLLMSGLLATIS
jgi:pimeloyl-ACP methyl ester carboxylesterase